MSKTAETNRTEPVWIRFEDYVTLYVGPFADEASALAHIETVCVPRGDSATFQIVSQEVYAAGSLGWPKLTPEEDAAFDPNA